MDEEMFRPLNETDHSSPDEGTAPIREPKPIVPVPDDAPPMEYEHPKLGRPDKVWTYRDAEGRVVAHVCRWNLADGRKEVRPVTFCDLGDGTQGWRSRGVPAPRSLFNLPEIEARPEAKVIITEGEKSSEAAALLFPDWVATTTMNGAMSPAKTDFSPLRGRTVIIAMDHDEAGRAYGEQVFRLLKEAGAQTVLLLEPKGIAELIWLDGKPIGRNSPIPDGWDLADAVEEGWTAETMREHVVAHDVLKPYAPEPEDSPAQDKRFRVTARGVEHFMESDDGHYWAHLCSPLEVAARTRSPDGEDWGLLLRITDADGRTKEWVMPGHLLADEGTECRRLLLAKGVQIAPGRRNQAILQAYLSLANPLARVTTVEKTGWQGEAFVLPHRTIARSDVAERVMFPRAAAEAHPYESAGSLSGWHQTVAKFAIGNSRLSFAISAAFVGPLLEATGAESGGFHFRGPSSIGKTTALDVATSVWGGRHFPASWRATSNGLEGIAASRSDTLLVLDEIGQCSAKEVGDVVYMLGNGVGKQRANRSGDPRPPKRFRSCFISSGEVSVADKMREDSRYGNTTGGQEVRVVDIPADAAQGLGLFEELHGHPSAEALARHLKAVCKENHGHAGVAFVQSLVADRAGALDVVVAIQNAFISDHCPKNADGQVQRVAVRFGLVAAVGELAIQYGILPWEKGEAVRAAVVCFNAWIEARGGTESHETRAHVECVRLFLEKYGISRFEHCKAHSDGSDDDKKQFFRDRAGYRFSETGKDDVYCILPEVWRKDVCKGLEPLRVAETLDRKGMLNRSKTRRQKQRRVPGVKNGLWFYEVKSSIFEHGDVVEHECVKSDVGVPPPAKPGDTLDFVPSTTPVQSERMKTFK